MIAMKVRAVLIESLHWATLALLLAGWLFVGPIWWEVLSFISTEPGGGEFLFCAAGVLLLATRWARRRPRSSVDGAYADVRTPQEVRHVARHEAAHAVVAWALGAQVTEISTQMVGTSGGRCSLASRPERPLVDEAWLLLRVCMASTVIEVQDRQEERGGCSTDLTQALAHASTIIATGRRPAGHASVLTLDALIGGAADEARAIIDQHEQLLEAVAERVAGGRTWHGPDLSALDQQTRATELVTS